MGLAFDTRHKPDELLERDEQLAMLTEALNEARLGQGRIVLIGGEAGSGKTTLVRAFCRRVEVSVRVLVGACDALSTPRPLGPLLDMATECDALAAVLASAAPPTAVFAALHDELAQQPTVLVLEDLHWGDAATFDVLRLLTRRIDMSALVLATYRDDGLHRDHPLRVLAGDLATVPAVHRLALGPLSPDAVAQLAVGHAIDPADLYARTGGNPFFVAQVLAAGGTGVPPTVRDAVLARAAGLTAKALEVLEAVAVTLPRAEPWLLEGVVSDAITHLDTCISTGLVVGDGDAIAFRHELARAAVEDAMAPTRRIALHRRVLATLEEAREGLVDPARLAHHAEAACDVDAVLEFAPAAAARAAATGAYREAAAQYARTLRVGAHALSPTRRAELFEGRSRACYLADDQVEAIAVVREAIASRRAEGAPSREARDLTELSTYLACRGLLTEAEEVMAEATRLVEGIDDSAEVAFVEAHGSMMSWAKGDPRGGAERARRGRAMALRVGDARTATTALVALGVIELEHDPEAGHALLLEAIAEARAAGFTEQHARALNCLGWFGLNAPHHAFAETYLREAIEFCVSHNEDLWRINALALAARYALDRGRWTEAAELANRILQDPRESPWPHHEALIVIALVRTRRGDPGATSALDEADAVGVPTDEADSHVDLAAARAEVAVFEQRPGDAVRATEGMLDSVRARGDAAGGARLLFWRRLAGLDAEAAPVGAEGPFALAVAGAWERAAAVWEQTGSPYEAVLAQIQAGDESSLRRALASSQELGALPAYRLATRRLRALGAKGLRRGPRRKTLENPAGLTAREVDVVRLVAQGLRNAEIAERLYLSPRTVDHHVSSILRKLDAGTRGEAGAKAAELDLLEAR